MAEKIRIKMIEVSSGWGNVPNRIVTAEDYYESAASSSESSGYDRQLIVEFDRDEYREVMCDEFYRDPKNPKLIEGAGGMRKNAQGKLEADDLIGKVVEE